MRTQGQGYSHSSTKNAEKKPWEARRTDASSVLSQATVAEASALLRGGLKAKPRKTDPPTDRQT